MYRFAYVLCVLVLLGAGCMPAADFGLDAVPTASCPDVGESDFASAKGASDQSLGQYGPWNSRLMVAYSDDGLDWERTDWIVSEQADVPDIEIDENGCLYLYYTAWEIDGGFINQTHVAISDDYGETWTYKFINIEGLSTLDTGSPLVDPDIQILDDGTFRLYLTHDSDGGDSGAPQSHYFESDDGINFTFVGVAFEDDENRAVLDPSILQLDDDEWIFFAGGLGNGGNWFGTSDDGTDFETDSMKLDYEGNSYMMANGLAVDGGYRFYSFSNTTDFILSWFSEDGYEWEAEEVVLEVDESSGLESKHVKDPTVIQLPDGSYIMIYKTTIPST